MPCFHPIDAWQPREHHPGASGKLLFTAPTGMKHTHLTIPCRRCRGCRLEHSRQWAVRIMHEAAMHQDNSFISLTYDEDHLPDMGTLVVEDFQNFMKRLRQHLYREAKKTDPNAERPVVRFYHAGEYGDKTKRPHYHAALFGLDFGDKTPWSKRGEHQTWRSETLEKLWPCGQSEIGTLTFESAAYIARYIMKKQNGKNKSRYEKMNRETGEIIALKSEYSTMSRNKGLGASWLEKFRNEVYPNDEIIINGRTAKPPRFYDLALANENPDLFDKIRAYRREARRPAEETPDRLAAREKIAEAQANLKRRPLE